MSGYISVVLAGGLISNSTAWQQVIAISVTIVCSSLAVSLRLLARKIHKTAYGWDDAFIVMALVHRIPLPENNGPKLTYFGQFALYVMSGVGYASGSFRSRCKYKILSLEITFNFWQSRGMPSDDISGLSVKRR